MSDVQFPDVGPPDVTYETYEPQDAIGKAIKNGAMLGGAGLFLAAVQNTVAKENVGMFGIFSRFGSSTALFGGCSSCHTKKRDVLTRYSWYGSIVRLCE